MPPQPASHKKWIAPILSIVVLAVLIYLGFRSTEEPTVVQPGEEVKAEEWPSEQVKKETITDTTKGYEITAAYPVTKGATITDLLKTFVEKQIDSFKADTSAAGELPEGYRAMTLDVTYEEVRNANADNYTFQSYSDTGGAHGLTATTTFTFTKTGEQVSVEDLFTNGLQGIGTIADIVQKELKNREFADAAWIEEGAAPTEDNYRNFIVEEGSVTFIFDPYQVAPYAAGIQRVTVPVSAFKSIANPEVFGSM